MEINYYFVYDIPEKGSTAVGHLSINKYIKDEISTHFL